MKNMEKSKVLLVDDEEIVRRSLSDWLVASGFQVVTAGDGEEALEIFRNGQTDAIVLDLKLPGIDGIEVLREMKALNPQAQVIIITAYGTVDNAVNAMKYGASDFITKPFEPEELEQAIGNVITRAKTEYEKEAQHAARMVELHVALGKEKLAGGKDAEALEQFRQALVFAPAHAEAAELKRQAEQKTNAASVTAPEKKEKVCIWSKMGIVAHRICILNHKCDECDFAQSIEGVEDQQDKSGFGVMRDKLLQLPPGERKCRYMLSGDVSFKLCSHLYQCGDCHYDQAFQDVQQEKAERALAKLQERRSKSKSADA